MRVEWAVSLVLLLGELQVATPLAFRILCAGCAVLVPGTRVGGRTEPRRLLSRGAQLEQPGAGRHPLSWPPPSSRL